MASAASELRLDEAQWMEILAKSGRPEAVMADAEPSPSSSSANLQQETLYVLALEGDAPDSKWKWWEAALDVVVQTMQPAPSMTHMELLIPPTDEADDMHFAVYLGKSANWGRAFSGGPKFYLDPNGNGKSWRAFPIVASDAVKRMRTECDRHRDTPYGSPYRLFNYPFSVPPLRSLAWMLDDSTGAPAHCASLVARCLHRGLPEINLPQASAWYGPSTLFLELSRKARTDSYRKLLEESETVRSTPETEEAARATETLLRGSDDAVRALSDAECRGGVDALCKKCLIAASGNDPTVERLAQKQLAQGLLRWSQIARASQAREPQPQPQPQPQPTGSAEGEADAGMFRR